MFVFSRFFPHASTHWKHCKASNVEGVCNNSCACWAGACCNVDEQPDISDCGFEKLDSRMHTCWAAEHPQRDNTSSRLILLNTTMSITYRPRRVCHLQPQHSQDILKSTTELRPLMPFLHLQDVSFSENTPQEPTGRGNTHDTHLLCNNISSPKNAVWPTGATTVVYCIWINNNTPMRACACVCVFCFFNVTFRYVFYREAAKSFDVYLTKQHWA